MSSFPDFHQYDGLGLAELVRTKQVTPLELVEECISRIEAQNPRINAVVYEMYDQARQAASGNIPGGPFHGVPFLLKDALDTVEGEPTSHGSKLLQDIRWPYDSELVRRYRTAGLIFVGKTNIPEFCIMPYTEPKIFGPANNPWDPALTAGGSSGGSAAAVASCMVPMAGGQDGGGSIRIPASCCGVFGLKPTRGRTPTGPDFTDPWRGCAISHVLTRSVRDSAAILDAIAGADTGAPYWAPPIERPYLEEAATEPGRLRIAFTSHPFMGRGVHQDCRQGLENTVRLLEELGHEVIEAAPQIDGEAFSAAFMTMVAAETYSNLKMITDLTGRKTSLSDFEAATRAMVLLGKALSAGDYAVSLNYLMSSARGVGRFFEEYDILLTPTLAKPPIPTGSLQLSNLEQIMIGWVGRLNASWLLKSLDVVKQVAGQIFEFIPYTALFNVTGQPAMSVPLYWNESGLPIGMHFVGRFGDEAALFRLAGQLERAKPWFGRTPAIK